MTHWEHSTPPRLLIVDDNPGIHRDFELVLLDDAQDPDLDAEERRMYGRQAGPAIAKPRYILEHALSGMEGVEKVQQALAQDLPFQLAFVDIRMPGIDGVETIQRIWQLDPAMQVVICTAFADYSWEDLVQRLGQTDKLLILKKPFDNIEVTLLASTLAEKWFLAKQAALKLEEMELLVAKRTQRVLDLQRYQSSVVHTDSSPAAPSDGSPSAKELPLVLLVEANPEIRLAVTQGLETEYRIVEAKDGEEGLQKAQEAVPDIVLTEFALPLLDGLALCRRLKSDELTSHIPVIMLTASKLEAAQIKALEAGADDCLAQPYREPLLKARIENLLRSRRQLHELFGREMTFQPRDVAANQVDAQFLRRTMETIEKHLADFEFDVEAMAHKMAVSRRQLFRKLKAVTGCTPNAFLRAMRLKRAARLLEESQMTVTEITYAVGFSDLKHFRNLFREQFGVLPGEYTKKVLRDKPSGARVEAAKSVS